MQIPRNKYNINKTLPLARMQEAFAATASSRNILPFGLQQTDISYSELVSKSF